MQALCQLDVQGEDVMPLLVRFFRENSEDPMVLELAQKWTQGTWEKVLSCDDLISQAAVRWKLSRLSHVDRAILRMSVYQLHFCNDIPSKVVINEAIEIAKRFGTAESPGFINGILDRIRRENAGDK